MKTRKHWIIVAFFAIFTVALAFIACDVGNGNNNEHICTFGEWTQTTPPDCTSAGIKTRVCTVCDTPDMETQVGDVALGHNWVDGECERCGVMEPGPVEFFRLTFEGRTTVLKAAPGIDQLKIDGVKADTMYAFDNAASDVDKRIVTGNVAIWTLVDENIDGRWEVIGFDSEGRGIVNSNNSSGAEFAVAIELIVIGDHIAVQHRPRSH